MLGEQRPQGRPLARVEPVGRRVGDPEQAQQLGVEGGLERADGEPAAVARLVDVVEGGAGVEQVGAALVGPEAGRDEPDDERGEVGRAVDDGGVDDLPPTARARLEQGGEHADGEVERAAAEVADEVDRHLGRPAGPADRAEGAGDGDVADVVPGGVGERTVLAPAGHPAVDEARVAGEAVVRARARAARRRPGR